MKNTLIIALMSLPSTFLREEYAYLPPVTDFRDPILEPMRTSDCYALCLEEWKITDYGGRPMKILACANQCEQIRRRFASEWQFEEQEHIRRYGKEYDPTLDGDHEEMERMENRLRLFYAEVDQMGGDYPRAFKRLDATHILDGKITYQEFKETLLYWNTGVRLGIHKLVFPRQYGDETFLDESFITVIFNAGDTNLNGSIEYTEFVNFYELNHQFDTDTLITVFMRPKMLSKDRFGLVIEEVTYTYL